MAIKYDPKKEFENTVLIMDFDGSSNAYYPFAIGKIENINGGSIQFIKDNTTVSELSAARFDGLGSNVKIPKNYGYDMGDGEFTVEFSIKPMDGNNLYQTIIGQDQDSYNPGTCYIQYRASGNRITFGSKDYSARPTVSGVSLNKRHDVVISRRSNGEFIIKVDGEISKSINTQIVDFNGGDLSNGVQFGYSLWDGNDGKLNAIVDGLRIIKGYSVFEGLTDEEIKSYVSWYERGVLKEIKGKVTLDEVPTKSMVTIASAEENVGLLGKTYSDPDSGEYKILTVTDKSALIFTSQNYGVKWSELTSKEIGDHVYPTVSNGYFYKVIKAGITGQTEPTWTAEQNVSINDGSVIYQSERLLKPEIEGYVTPTPIS